MGVGAWGPWWHLRQDLPTTSTQHGQQRPATQGPVVGSPHPDPMGLGGHVRAGCTYGESVKAECVVARRAHMCRRVPIRMRIALYARAPPMASEAEWRGPGRMCTTPCSNHFRPARGVLSNPPHATGALGWTRASIMRARRYSSTSVLQGSSRCINVCNSLRKDVDAALPDPYFLLGIPFCFACFVNSDMEVLHL